ncbi:hypothetical protein M514_25919 [Trichuris suis]|uniref:Uncharacterized protein n=1 Tax=Trichuris suis TaxID=68888 RepID=A0A085MXG4_9BILA|nr:hypothetical protein M514_25919 [Trichuris suis]
MLTSLSVHCYLLTTMSPVVKGQGRPHRFVPLLQHKRLHRLASILSNLGTIVGKKTYDHNGLVCLGSPPTCKYLHKYEPQETKVQCNLQSERSKLEYVEKTQRQDNNVVARRQPVVEAKVAGKTG